MFDASKQEIAIRTSIQSKGKSTPEIIVALLADEWPLSARGIQRRMAKSYSKQISFQATSKTLKKMREGGVIVKQEKYYQISREWLLSVRNFAIRIIAKYETSATKLKGIP